MKKYVVEVEFQGTFESFKHRGWQGVDAENEHDAAFQVGLKYARDFGAQYKMRVLSVSGARPIEEITQ